MVWILGFGLSVAFLLYVLFGYPLVLGYLAQSRKRPVKTAPIEPGVSFIVAVHNGERFIEQKLQSILNLEYPLDRMEILIASDGCTDRTEEIVGRYARPGIRLLRLPRAGKPSALNAAMREASNDLLVFTDVRQELAPESLAMLVQNFADPEVGAASGELVILRGDTREQADVGLYWRYEFWIRLRLSAIDSIFGATGAYYALRRNLAIPIPPDSLLDDMYLPLHAFFRGYRLVVDPRARMFDHPTNLEAEFRRKVRTLAGNYQILRSYPQLLGPRNRLWFHFYSYKFARLLLPFGLLAILTFSFGLPSPWKAVALLGQAAFYAAALADRWIPEGILKKATSPAHTFVALMAATLCAVSVFFVPTAKLWKPSPGR